MYGRHDLVSVLYCYLRLDAICQLAIRVLSHPHRECFLEWITFTFMIMLPNRFRPYLPVFANACLRLLLSMFLRCMHYIHNVLCCDIMKHEMMEDTASYGLVLRDDAREVCFFPC